MSAVWAVQAPLLGLLGVFWLIWPQRAFGLGPTSTAELLVAMTILASVPGLIGLGLASAYAAMREDPLTRRRLARGLAVGLLGWGLVAAAQGPLAPSPLDDVVQQHQSHLADLGRTGLFLALGLVNLLFAAWPLPPRTKDPRLSGRADTRPPWLPVLWTLQAVALAAFAVALAVVDPAVLVTFAAPLDVLRDACVRPPSPPIAPELLAAARELMGVAVDGLAAACPVVARGDAAIALGAKLFERAAPLWGGLGLVALAGIPETQASNWRGFRVVHVLWLAAWVVAIGLGWSAGVTPAWIPVATAGAALVLLAANVVAGRQPANWVAAELGDEPDGWTFVDLIAGPLIALRVLLMKRRGTHGMGVGARGRMVVPDRLDPRVPRQELFREGRAFDACMRFANVTFTDDAGMDVRGAALRLASPDQRSPFDMLMNTGSAGPVSDLVGFTLLVASKFFPKVLAARIVQRDRAAREGGIAGLRRAPESYALVRYHAQTTRYWLDADDVRHLVRYRLIPQGRSEDEESGLMDPVDVERPWDRDRRPGEARERDYLRRELARRLEGGVEVAFHLQAQFHTPRPGDTLAWYDTVLDWPADDHPWLTVGEVVLTAPLPDEVTERLVFNSANHPPSLGIPEATGPRDPRSLADSERRIIRRTAALRAWMYDALGLPRFGPDTGRWIQ